MAISLMGRACPCAAVRRGCTVAITLEYSKECGRPTAAREGMICPVGDVITAITRGTPLADVPEAPRSAIGAVPVQVMVPRSPNGLLDGMPFLHCPDAGSSINRLLQD